MIIDPGNKKIPEALFNGGFRDCIFVKIRNSVYCLNNFFSLIIAVAVSGNIFSHPDSPSTII